MDYIIQHDFARYMPQTPDLQIDENKRWFSEEFYTVCGANDAKHAKEIFCRKRNLNPFYFIAIPKEQKRNPIVSQWHEYRNLQY